MRMRLAFATVCLGMLPVIAPLQAHHSFSATYDVNKPISFKGKITKLGWTNPHAHVFVEVKAPSGEMVTFEVETGAATALIRSGIRREDLMGAEVTIKGFLAKDGSPTVNASSMTLTDSKKEFTQQEAGL